MLDEIEGQIQDAYLRLNLAVAEVKYCHEHYLDGLAAATRERTLAAATEFARMRDEAKRAYEQEEAASEAARSQAAGDLAGTVRALVSAPLGRWRASAILSGTPICRIRMPGQRMGSGWALSGSPAVRRTRFPQSRASSGMAIC